MGILVYDADCGFCTTSAMWLAKTKTFTVQAWQFIDDLGAAGLTIEMVSEAAHWVEGGQRVASGSDAIAKAMIARGGAVRVMGYVTQSWLIRPAAHLVYRQIAKNRHLMPGGTAACRLPQS